MFNPPLHRQRHHYVIDFVKRNKPLKVVDLGCGECSLLKKLKFHREIELLVGVDIDGAKSVDVLRFDARTPGHHSEEDGAPNNSLIENLEHPVAELKDLSLLRKHGLAPLSTDYLQPSYDQLRIELYQGSVTQKDVRFRGFDLVTCVELIEHLTPVDVEGFSEVVFGYMTPVTVIVSTPNSEFNCLLPGLTGFRHSDHKFEWTRAEFQAWALKVCLDYSYQVEFTGVGEAPPGQQQSVGYCTQIGVFQRLREGDGCNMLCGDDTQDLFSYTLLYTVNYPSLRDNNILRRVLVSEVLYWTEKLKTRWMEENTEERDDGSTLCQTEGGVEGCLGALERCMEMEQTAACGEERKHLMEHWVGAMSEAQECPDEEASWTNTQENQESCKLQRCVSVPLAVLWSCCPKIGTLSGSLNNLRHLLMGEPKVQLSQDGSAVLVHVQDIVEEDQTDWEDSGYAEACLCSHSAEQEEDWEANE